MPLAEKNQELKLTSKIKSKAGTTRGLVGPQIDQRSPWSAQHCWNAGLRLTTAYYQQSVFLINDLNLATELQSSKVMW